MNSFLNLEIFDSSICCHAELDYPLVRLYEEEPGAEEDGQQFELFSDSDSVQIYSPKKFAKGNQLLSHSQFNLKSISKTRVTENTRADSSESLSEKSDLSKVISKKHTASRQSIDSKSAHKAPKSAKSVKKSATLKKIKNSKDTKQEYSSKYKKEFTNA